MPSTVGALVLALLLLAGACAALARQLGEASADRERLRGELELWRSQGAEDPEDLQQLVSLGRYAECILESMTSGVIVVDTLSRVTLVNKEAATILRRPADQLVGTMLMEYPNLGELFRLINSIRSTRPLYERSSQQFEVRVEDFEDGTVIPLGVSVNALLDEDQVVLGYVAICKDLSALKQLQATVERSERLSALGTMASGVAHNFNNILAAILGRVQLLLRYPDRMDVQAGLDTIQKSAMDGAATVKRLQDFARTRVSDSDFCPVDLHEVVRDTVEFSRNRWQERAREEGRQFEVTEDLAATRSIAGAASELREVLLNLINNALDAMPKGGRLHLATRDEGDEVVVTVRDSGSGMPEEVRQHIFDPFFSTKGAKGMGLGLAESYGIVKRHRGNIHVESEVGKGTTFEVRFPAGKMTEVVEGGDEAAAAPVRTGRVLVVDDERDQTEILTDMLEPEGHQVVSTQDPEEAARLLEDGEFDLLISDLSMPGMSGWDLSRRARDLHPEIGIMVVTGLGGGFGEEELRKAGADLCLPKPVTLERILQAVEELLGPGAQSP